MFNELSFDVLNNAYERIKNIYQESNDTKPCHLDRAWSQNLTTVMENSDIYQNCTQSISQTHNGISDIFECVEYYAANTMDPNVVLETIMAKEFDRSLLEEIYLSPLQSEDGLDAAIRFFKKPKICNNTGIICSDHTICQIAARKIVLQLKMMEWGIFGVADSPAGQFLAFHHKVLGNYFSSDSKNNWPRIPFKDPPTPLETAFNEKMMKITEIITNGTVKGKVIDLLGLRYMALAMQSIGS